MKVTKLIKHIPKIGTAVSAAITATEIMLKAFELYEKYHKKKNHK